MELMCVDTGREADPDEVTQCMDTCVGSTGALHLDRSGNDHRSALGKHPLDRPVSFVSLPTVKIGSVISDHQTISVRLIHQFARLQSSAIWTVLRAAPLSTWSPTTQN